jgi:hypothetical protein
MVTALAGISSADEANRIHRDHYSSLAGYPDRDRANHFLLNFKLRHSGPKSDIAPCPKSARSGLDHAISSTAAEYSQIYDVMGDDADRESAGNPKCASQQDTVDKDTDGIRNSRSEVDQREDQSAQNDYRYKAL